MKDNWYLGLDMGTDSVGWAATDEEYNLIRRKGKDLWGIRKFEEASTAAERRTNRGARRRITRERARIGLIRSYFADEINNIDPYFFIRMDNSSLWPVDKDGRISGKYSLFADEKYTDKEYYDNYPTIYHLRKELIENNKAPYDVRLVYLAIHNLFKRRGHFLLNSSGDELSDEDIKNIYLTLVQRLADIDITISSNGFDELLAILNDKEMGKKAKYEECQERFSIGKQNKKEMAFYKCVCGLSIGAVDLFGEFVNENVSICISKYSFNDETGEIVQSIGDDNFEIIEMMKEIYDYAALIDIKKGYKYLSFARVDDYEKHKSDLKLLKNTYKQYKTKEEYDLMFRADSVGGYSNYVNSCNSEDSLFSAKKYRRNMSGSKKQEDLYSRIKKDLAGIEDSNVKYIFDEIEKETFLPKQLTGANGVIPNQLHKAELIAILNNAEKYCDFLNNKDESGYTVSERIIMLFSFHMPYYIGPINEKASNHWSVRKESGAVLPWNLNQKIDIAKTSENFITTLIRDCTYIAGAKVLPKASLLYEKYCVLNEINNIKINNEPISTELKKAIYNDLFCNGKKIKKSQLVNYLVNHGAIDKAEEVTGIDLQFNNSLSSYGKFYSIFGEALKEDWCIKLCEDIIYYGTVFGDSKEMYKSKLSELLLGVEIEESSVKRIGGFKFKDWGRLSREILELNACDKSTGESVSIIRAMWDTNYNFMELIHSDAYTFAESLSEYKNNSLKTLSEFTAKDLNEYYFSAPVKRMIWQTIEIIHELVKVMGSQPERIFVEMTRKDDEKGDKGRKDSRGKQLLELYKNIKNTESHDWKKEITIAQENGSLRSKKLFLYYSQMGKDMYTGNPIDIEELFTNKYDIDHIYPRHFVKDDSIHNNLVLVNKTFNEHEKRDLYPIPDKIAGNEEVRQLWDMLHQKKLINDEKYHRLICRTPFDDNQLAGFISRQIVETGQATKGVADILKLLLPETTLVYSKATNVSDFRRDNGYLKSRLVNDYHHAQDAYLNIVVGNAYYTKFTQNPIRFIKNEYRQDSVRNNYNMARMFDRDITRGNKIAWKASKNGTDGTINTVTKVMEKNSPLHTRMSVDNKGKLYDITIRGKYVAKPLVYAPIKSKLLNMSDVTKYGGYSSLNPAYFVFIEHQKGKKKIKCFESVPVLFTSRINTAEELKRYFEDTLGYSNVRIICEHIKKYSLIRIDGYYAYIVGFSSNGNVEMHNAVNLNLSRSDYNYIHYIEKYIETGNINEKISVDQNIRLYEKLIDKHLNGIFSKSPKTIGNALKQGKEKFENLSIEEQLKLLKSILKVSSIGASTEDLRIIGGTSEAGRMRFSGNMTNRNELLLINQSVTGIFESGPIDLLKL